MERILLVHQLTAVNAGTLAVALASFSNPEGFFCAKLSATSVVQIIVFGWLTQRQLARGLTFRGGQIGVDMAAAGLDGPRRKDRAARG